jgi:hypothetical protein
VVVVVVGMVYLADCGIADRENDSH